MFSTPEFVNFYPLNSSQTTRTNQYRFILIIFLLNPLLYHRHRSFHIGSQNQNFQVWGFVFFSFAAAIFLTGCSDPHSSHAKQALISEYAATPFKDKHPEASLEVIAPYVKKNAVILDLSNGSRVGLRQLMANGFTNVTTVKSHHEKLVEGQQGVKKVDREEKIILGDIQEGLPIRAAQFDVITSFSAFPCHTNVVTLQEIARLLKPQGYLFIMRGLNHKSDPIRAKLKKIIEKHLDKTVVEKHVDTIKLLKDQGFSIILDSTIPITEYFTPDEYIDYIAPYCFWEEAMKSPLHKEILLEVRQYLNSIANSDGVIIMDIHAPILLAQKES